jgi:hypothetical protein
MTSVAAAMCQGDIFGFNINFQHRAVKLREYCFRQDNTRLYFKKAETFNSSDESAPFSSGFTKIVSVKETQFFLVRSDTGQESLRKSARKNTSIIHSD